MSTQAQQPLTEAELVRRARSARSGGVERVSVPLPDDADSSSSSTASSRDSNSSFPSRLAGGGGAAVRRRVEAGARRSIDHWKVLAFGQMLSFLRFAVGASATELYRKCGLSAPATQTGVAYYLLLLTHGTRFFFPRVFGGWCGGGGGGERSTTKNRPGTKGSDTLALGGSADDADKSRRGWFPVFPIPLHAPLRTYFLIALLHVEGNYLFFLSLRFTTFTSNSIFSNLAVPAAVVFSRLLLRRRYRAAHLLGVALCLAGVALNVIVDYQEQARENAETGADDADSEDEFGEAAVEEYPRRMLGDALAVVGGTMLGVIDVLFERAVRTSAGGPREFLPMLGLFGAIISTVQVLLFELPDLAQFSQGGSSSYVAGESTLGVATAAAQDAESSSIVGAPSTSMDQESSPSCTTRQSLSLLLAGCSLSTYMLVAGAAHFLTASESALLNLSYLTEDWWSVIFSVVAVGYVPRPLFYLALVLVLIGVFVYETGPSPAGDSAEGGQQRGGEVLLELDDGLGAVSAGKFTGEGPKDVELSSSGGSSSFGDEGPVPTEKALPDIT